MKTSRDIFLAKEKNKLNIFWSWWDGNGKCRKFIRLYVERSHRRRHHIQFMLRKEKENRETDANKILIVHFYIRDTRFEIWFSLQSYIVKVSLIEVSNKTLNARLRLSFPSQEVVMGLRSCKLIAQLLLSQMRFCLVEILFHF